jgi:hypothetical protein
MIVECSLMVEVSIHDGMLTMTGYSSGKMIITFFFFFFFFL